MRIFISTQLFYPAKLGGPANAVYWLAKALVRSGHAVTVVTTNISVDSSVKTDCWIIRDGIRVIYCSNSKIPYLNVIKNSLNEIKNADIVILTSVCYKPEIIIAIKAAKYHIPVIWSPRGEFSVSAINNRIDKKIFFSFIRKILLKNAVFHVTSPAEKEDTIRVLGKRATTLLIPNYMEIPAKVGRDSNVQPYFLFLGRIAPIKAIDKLIKGLSLSEKFKSSNFILRIVGIQEEKFKGYVESLQLLIGQVNLNKKISIEEPKFGNDKLKLLSNASFLTLLSESENFGNVVIEALSQSTPVIASHGTPWSILEEFKAGAWIDNSPENIAKTIDYVIDLDIVQYENMRKQALSVVKRFDVFENINQWNDALSTLLNKHNRNNKTK